jgi:hypothetical protein
MKTHRKRQQKSASTPQKSELEIAPSSVLGRFESNFFEEIQEFQCREDGTSHETPDRSVFTAPVRIPSRDKLAVDMVPYSLVYLYDEYRSEEAKASAWFFAFIGAFLGVIINWTTSEPLIISKTSIVVELILVVTIVLLGSFTYSFNKRAKAAKSQIDELVR